MNNKCIFLCVHAQWIQKALEVKGTFQLLLHVYQVLNMKEGEAMYVNREGEIKTLKHEQ